MKYTYKQKEEFGLGIIIPKRKDWNIVSEFRWLKNWTSRGNWMPHGMIFDLKSQQYKIPIHQLGQT